MGLQINAITHSGTNRYAGSLSGYFRDDKLNAKDFIVQRVLPYSNQQLSATFGGPIQRDRVHFFANYEVEREPRTLTNTSPYPLFNVSDERVVRNEIKAGAKLNAQFSPETRLMLRGNRFSQSPVNGVSGATVHPSAANILEIYSNQLFGNSHTGARSERF